MCNKGKGPLEAWLCYALVVVNFESRWPLLGVGDRHIDVRAGLTDALTVTCGEDTSLPTKRR